MDVYEATRIVLLRIQSLDPENASKIMGLLLIQDHGEREMIRLAFGPENLLHSVILKARMDLGLPSISPSTPSTPSSPSPFFSRRSSSASSRFLGSGTAASGINGLPSSWSSFTDLQNPDDNSYNVAGNNGVGAVSGDLIDEFQIRDQFSFLNDGSPILTPRNSDLIFQNHDLSSSPSAAESMLFPPYTGGGGANWGNGIGSVHRRSCSVSDAACLGNDDVSAGFGWKSCHYFARGYCKNGINCRFLHDGVADSPADSVVGVGSPGKLDLMDQCHELLRSKSAHQQRLAAAFPYSPKTRNFLIQQQQQNDSPRAAAALMRLERNEFSMNGGLGMLNAASRQIYLTFPAESTFREEDVSNYFSIYGPVQDVRIPYQQKRMFGFVTFLYPETVKLILAKGNPHFVCDARVLVKPYKEKGKVPDKYRKLQQIERGEFSPCGTPTGLDSRDPFDLQLGGGMFYGSPDILWRKKLEEQADLQQALELQSQRLMGLQLLDVKQHHHHRALSTGSPIPSPTFNQTLVLPSFLRNPDGPRDKCSSPAVASSLTSAFMGTANANGFDENCISHERLNGDVDDNDLHDCLEHNLPDSPFASPVKGPRDNSSPTFANVVNDGDKDFVSATTNNGSTASSLDMASFKSFNCQLPRFSSGNGAIGMYSGTGNPTCHVGI